MPNIILHSKIHCLFSSVDKEIEYLADRNFDLAQADLLLLHGRNQEAAELHLAEGRILEAVDILLASKDSLPDASRRAISCILAGLWNLLSMGAILDPARVSEAQKYLQKASQLDDVALDENERAEVRHSVLPNSFFDKWRLISISFPLDANVFNDCSPTIGLAFPSG